MATVEELPVGAVCEAQGFDSGETFLIEGISWATYEALLADVGASGRRIRMSYDDGSLEFMTVSAEHEWGKKLLARMIEAMTEELDVPIRSSGGTTFKSQLKKKGLEPDECYWIANQPAVRGRRELDLDLVPKPDLVLEIEVSRKILPRLPIYAALGFPEIWRYTGKTLHVLALQADGTYARTTGSPSFPFLDMAVIARLMKEFDGENETRFIRSFRQWVRDEVFPRFRGPVDGAPHA